MLGPEIELNLNIPEPTQNALSFAEHSPAAIGRWVAQLPMANVGETSRQLYQAIIELNKMPMSAMDRSEILEKMRPPIRFVCEELSKHFLNQSIALPEKQQKIANLTQAMQIHLATGYKIVMMDSLSSMGSEKVRKNFACAAHRMLSEYGQVLLRANQLYSMAPKSIWLEMHEVYQFCETIDLLKYVIVDETNAHRQETRIDNAYKRNLLLSCCRPNQLRQRDLQAVYATFEVWSDYVEVGAEFSSSAVFVISMQQDAPPRYRSLLPDTLTDYYYGFDTAELVSRLNNHLGALTQRKDSGIVHVENPESLNEPLLKHLDHAFGILTKRTFKRIANSGHLNLCVGLSAAHYYVSGEIEFHTQMLTPNQRVDDSDSNIFMQRARRQHDAWNEAFDASGAASNTGPSSSPINFDRPVGSGDASYPQYKVPLTNTSPGGYCLQWNGDVPSNIQAGEILAIRETEKQPWSIAVIRWIRHAKQKGTQAGIELLAPHARPCGVQLLHKTGAPSEFLRGLLLP
ncbi:MAG: GTPase, partial [Oleiphilaceae bacterium]|nr:GTPase [Oleiphilaceae bacterium]